MRVAKDFIVFSKTKEQHVCIYMSRTFHEDEKIDEVIVPIPSWDSKNRRPFPSTPEDLERVCYMEANAYISEGFFNNLYQVLF